MTESEIDWQKIFDSLPDEKKIEFLTELQEIVELEDEQLAAVQRVMKETIEELEEKK